MNAQALTTSRSRAVQQAGEAVYENLYVTMDIGGQLFGMATDDVQFAHIIERMAPVPLAPREVAGILQVHGSVVTVLDLRACLNMPAAELTGENMSMAVEDRGTLYCLMVDKILDVISIPREKIEPAPSTLDPRWRAVSTGVHRHDDKLLVIVKANEILALVGAGEKKKKKPEPETTE